MKPILPPTTWPGVSSRRRQGLAAVGLLALSLLLGACGGGGGGSSGSSGAAAPEPRWVAAFARSAEPAVLGYGGIEASALNNETVRQSLTVTGTGARVRIRVSNRFGTAALRIGGAAVARSGASADGIVGGSSVALNFGGAPTVDVPAGTERVSDPVDLAVAAGDRLSISLYLPQPVPSPDWHWIASSTQSIAPGNQLAATQLSGPRTTTSGYILSGVDVLAPASWRSVVLLGDSLIDGFAATVDAQATLADGLFRRLLAAGRPLALANAGIAGNRLLNDGIGTSTLGRLDGDALDLAGVSHVVVLVGINDIGLNAVLQRPGQDVTADQLIAGLTQLAARAHAKGIKVIGGTLPPFEGTPIPGYYTAAGEARRQQLNAWIRTTPVFDGFVDFDLALRDPAVPTRLRAEFDSGDHLHPSDAGYAAMAAAVDLRGF